MASAGVNLAILVLKAMEAHSTQDGCPWKDGAFEEAMLSPEFSAFEKKLNSLEICDMRQACSEPPTYLRG